MDILFDSYYCKKCGKEFFPTPDHVYKDSHGKYCSWTCFNHRNEGPEFKQVEMYDDRGVLIKIFDNAEDAANYVGGTVGGMRWACTRARSSPNKMYKYKKHLWKYKEG